MEPASGWSFRRRMKTRRSLRSTWIRTAIAPGITGIFSFTICRPSFATAGAVDGSFSPTLATTQTWCCSTRPLPSLPAGDRGAARAKSKPSNRSAAAYIFAARATDWGDDSPPRTPLEDSVIYELHVRGFTCHPVERRRPAGHLRRLDREDPLPAVARRHRGRAAADPRVRRMRLPLHQSRSPANGCATSGATTPSPSPPPRRRMPQSGAGARPGRRVPRHGHGLPRRRDRGDPRRGLQPHRRRRRPRPDLFVPRPRQRAVLHARSGRAAT